MNPICDALELLTAQHEEIDDLLAVVAKTHDARTFDRLAERVVMHLAGEQLVFYPVVESTMSSEVYTELLQEHSLIKRVLAELVWLGVEDAGFDAKLDDLTRLVAGHAVWQEEQLFEEVAEAMPCEALAALGRQMQENVTSAFPMLAAA